MSSARERLTAWVNSTAMFESYIVDDIRTVLTELAQVERERDELRRQLIRAGFSTTHIDAVLELVQP